MLEVGVRVPVIAIFDLVKKQIYVGHIFCIFSPFSLLDFLLAVRSISYPCC